MFDFVNERKRIVQAIMAIATLPFLFWGIESYRNTGSEDYVAIVTGEKFNVKNLIRLFATSKKICAILQEKKLMMR